LLDANRFVIYYKYLIILFYNLKMLVDYVMINMLKNKYSIMLLEVYKYSDCFN